MSAIGGVDRGRVLMSENNAKANQTPPPINRLTEERVKEIVTEALIELGIVPQPQKQKAMSVE
jgi:hypothetical protein